MDALTMILKQLLPEGTKVEMNWKDSTFTMENKDGQVTMKSKATSEIKVTVPMVVE